MPIQLPEPIVTTPIESKTYDSVWIQNLSINSPNPNQPVETYIKVCPYNSQTGEILENQPRMIIIQDTYAKAAENSAVAQAMGAIFAAVQSLLNE